MHVKNRRSGKQTNRRKLEKAIIAFSSFLFVGC